MVKGHVDGHCFDFKLILIGGDRCEKKGKGTANLRHRTIGGVPICTGLK